MRSAPPLRIVDQNGQLALSGAPSVTSTIVDVTVGPDFAFHPDTVNISVGDTLRWTWDGSGHSVTSGHPCAADSQFCSPNDMNCFPGVLSNEGTVYQHTFANAGTYSYFCLSHCLVGMTGVVNVSSGCAQAGWSAGPDMPSTGISMVGVYFVPNGKLYVLGGRSTDGVGNDFMHPFEYDPAQTVGLPRQPLILITR
jgi:plastocyanin